MKKVSFHILIENDVKLAWFVEKAAFDALQDSEGVYEELEDDFLFIANEGQVALKLAEEEKTETEVEKK